MLSDGSGDWQPTAALDILKLRARILERIRAFFFERGVLEVETPILSSAATTDPALASLSTRYTGPLFPHGQTLYLHTSPEFPMKRLLAAGAGSIYQICKVFRDGESGRLHNPEFTMLEWYRVGFDHHRLMDETGELVMQLLASSLSLQAPEKLTYREAFIRHASLDPHRATAEEFARAARDHHIDVPRRLRGHDDLAAWRDLLLTHLVEPGLGQGRLTFIHDYPAAQASLARVQPGDPPLAARFELYLNGVELANGFHELADANEQRTRFERQLHARTVAGLSAVPMDAHLLAALTHGMPDCAGVALGIDRLVMLAAGARSIAEVIPFPIDRA
ncbi:MAG TPA: EF-P lysine aminoacylase EpmA [Candidatus Methylomirabilis sp.]|nr:EF-P lysine aminoacylase EpmA [Candidatus Methylomirabilis sp.]